jgi:dTDP-4-dehydrorhamnose reductase
MENRKQITKVVVLGASGMLGYALVEYYKSRNYEVVATTRKEFNVLSDSIEKLEGIIKGSDFIVNAIGIIKPRIASMKPEDVLMINGTFPKNLAKLSNKLGIPCFHITTDCVYSGSKGGYTEDDHFDISDMYGLSKNAGENADCMTIRTSIIGEELSNKYSLLEWARSQKENKVNGFTNHKWNGVTTLYLGEILESIYSNNLYRKGIYHVHSVNTVSKYELLQLISSAYDLNLDISPSEADFSIDRSLESIYELTKIVSKKNLSEQIFAMYEFFSNQ